MGGLASLRRVNEVTFPTSRELVALVEPMTEVRKLELILDEAGRLEGEYSWLKAAETYGKGEILISPEEALELAELHQHWGHALYRAALQAENLNEFRMRIQQAIDHYKDAVLFHRKNGGQRHEARALVCDGMIAYLSYWLAGDLSERRRLLDESWNCTERACVSFLKIGEPHEYARTFNLLSFGAYLRGLLEWDAQVQSQRFREVVEHGEKAIDLLSSVGKTSELAEACVKTSNYLTNYAYYYLDLPEREKTHQRIRDYWSKAEELSKETALLEMLSVPSLGYWAWGEGTDETIERFEEALHHAEKTQDNLLVGFAHDWLCYHNFWKAIATDNPEEKVQLRDKVLEYAEGARRAYSKISFTSPRGWVAWVEEPRPEFYFALSLTEIDLTKRRELLQEALELAPKVVEKAEESGYPALVSLAHHVCSKILASAGKLESDPGNMKRFLEEALKHRNESIELSKSYLKFAYWDRGVYLNYLANIKTELAALDNDSQAKKEYLQDAVETKRAALDLLHKELEFYQRIGSVSPFSALGYWQVEYGDLLSYLYESVRDANLLRQSTEAYKHAAELYQRLGFVSRIAECYWKVAQVFDTLGEYERSADSFALAAKNYTSSGETIAQLDQFYRDHAAYMQGWSEIEKAKHHHGREEYGAAKEYYERAASLHESTLRWNYLATNYSAWAQVEGAEDLSRQEKCEEALKAFKEATRRFQASKGSLEKEFSKVEFQEEHEMILRLIKAAGRRERYCASRVVLEEARLLDKRGDHSSSSEKYGLATELLEGIVKEVDSEQDRREMALILELSRAWQKMTLAEAEAAPELYAEAAKLFEAAKDQSHSEKGKLLLLGHSRFCKAIEAGARFSDTADEAQHAVATQHLEAASKYYLKAGYQSASEYAKASELLFDAYAHIDAAKREKDQEKKAKLYVMAETVLQASANAYSKAEQPSKREQVLSLLGKVKEERELAVSLSEVLHAPSIVSTTEAFSTPTPTHERAVGLQRFENADVQANVIPHRRNLRVGEDLDLEIEMVNAGRGMALLIKMEELVPEGFELAERPEAYRMEERYLNLKGRRLDPLKSEEVRLVLRPKVQGHFLLKPRILYLDENGTYKSHEPTPAEVTVKELGVSGWIKGH